VKNNSNSNQFNNKRILITGGAGYIGSHVCLALKDTGADVAIIDNLSTGFTDNIHFGTLHHIDLSHWNETASFIQSYAPDAILHFAGSIIAPESVLNPLKYYQNNTANTANLLRCCVDYHVPHFLFSSTAAVYGEVGSGICKENDPLMPINPYGRSKLMTEMMLEDTALSAQFSYAALRYFNVAGTDESKSLGQRHSDSTHLIKIIAQVLSGKRDKMAIFGSDYPTPDGTCIRDYIHVSDLANAHILALQYLFDGGVSDVFNCGYSHGFSVKDVIQTAQKLYGGFIVEQAPRREGDPANLIANADKIKQTLGWVPQHNQLETIIQSAVDFERLI
jgi:UDP-glucose 4-epimerase